MTRTPNTPTTITQRLRAGDTLYGVIVKMPGPAIVEMCGHAGFDLVMIDTEHGANDGEALEHHLRAADSAGVEAIVRIGSESDHEILRALDAGATGVVAPHINNGADAARVVAQAHYPPVGSRGLAVSTRAGKHGFSTLTEHVAAAAEHTMVVVQIEDRQALEHVDSIASTPRVDAVFVGPSDLSISLGLPGQLAHPDVVAAINQIATGVNKADSAALCVLVDDETQAHAWQARGARLILFSAVSLIAQRFRAVGSAAHAQPVIDHTPATVEHRPALIRR
jgi:4-hydroxy-2-oxoheptanedioate aldolase